MYRMIPLFFVTISDPSIKILPGRSCLGFAEAIWMTRLLVEWFRVLESYKCSDSIWTISLQESS